MSETKNKVTDEQALELLKTGSNTRAKIANFFVPRTIFHAVEVEYKPGIKTPELRTFVQQGSFCSASQWERALELEKEFSGLNKKFQNDLKAQGKPVNIKGSNNPLKATPLNLR